ncbi:hypothetical protein LCGC14_2278290 [marine sediment metagenome]|uniref:Uncharacterized protein n=1 Tax=marine sediment metagenome TaxID=412755 RepID=A0A0F9DH49_9ZZZZ
MPEEVNPLAVVPCPKCGEPLWFYRIYQVDLMLDREGDPIEIGDIADDPWDHEEVACPSCGHKPKYHWEETGLGHIIILNV